MLTDTAGHAAAFADDCTPPTSPVVHTLGRYGVQAASHLVAWKDGSTLTLHRVQQHGSDTMFLRAFQDGAQHWLVFDLRDVTPRSFELDVKTALGRDHEGIALFALRLNYATARDFMARVLKHLKAHQGLQAVAA